MSTPLLYLSAADVRRALPMTEAIGAARRAFVQLSSGEVSLPPRQHMDVSEQRGVGLVMACHSGAQGMFSLKFITLFDRNAMKGLPLIHSLVILTDGATGEHLALMDGASLTALRTGAASGVATDVLARPDAQVACVFGAGVQARSQLRGVCCVRPIREAFVLDTQSSAAEQYAAEMTRELGLSVSVAEGEAATRKADVICTATTSSLPVFEDSWLQAGAHINAVGSYKPHVTEVPAATVCRARIVVDHLPSALEEAGDLLTPLRQGLIDPSRFETELGAVLMGKSPGRLREEQIALFKSVGVAIQDLCAAATVLENARRLGLGTLLQ